ncbi:MAG: tetratricopeptide repeat protein [Bryobacteraceae bacterium]
MLIEHLRILVDFFWRPLYAVSRVLDHGRLGWAVGFAIVTALLLQLPEQRGQLRRAVELTQKANRATGEQKQPSTGDMAELRRQTEVMLARDSIFGSGAGLGGYVVLAGVFAPLAIVILAYWDGLGRGGSLLRRDYGSALACLSMAWTASRLPAVPLEFARQSLPNDPPWGPWIMPGAWALFLVFATAALRTVPGGRWFSSAVTSVVSGCAMLGAGLVTPGLGSSGYFLFSPWILYYLWSYFGSGVSGLGDTFRSGQNYRRALEATSINPHDSDAQYQLGLIEMQRRKFPEAEKRFREAVRIDSKDADYHYQLGRSLSEQGRFAEACESFGKAAALNDKASNHEVLRDLGATQLALQHLNEAVQSLEAYVARREYDPVGLVYYGRTLKQQGRAAEAKRAFEQAVEAWRTMPDWRAAELRVWERAARDEMKKL